MLLMGSQGCKRLKLKSAQHCKLHKDYCDGSTNFIVTILFQGKLPIPLLPALTIDEH